MDRGTATPAEPREVGRLTPDTVAGARETRRLYPMLTAPRLAAGVAGAVTATLFVARSLSWPSAASYDAWAYAAWGQSIARGEQLVYNAATTPKPLASLLAAIVSPLPPTRAWGLVVALALGVVIGALVAAGFRDAGALGAAVAAVAFLVVAPIDWILALSLVDAVTAALVVLAIALRGKARIACFVLAGLLRPEAWLAGALAAYVELHGSRVRRALAAVAFGALPALLWAALDFALAGDPLATREYQQGLGADELGGSVSLSPLAALDLFRDKVVEFGTVFVVVGGVGLLVHAWRMRRDGFSFPLAVALVWTASLIAEAIYGFEVNARYLLPLVAVLALGWGLLAGAAARFAWNRRPGLIWVAAGVAIAATSLTVVRMDFGPRAKKWERTSLAAYRSLPAIEPLLECGRLGLVGRRHVGGTISQLAASSRTSLARFERADSSAPARYAGILAVDGKETARLPAGWPRRGTPLGPLAINPECPGPVS